MYISSLAPGSPTVFQDSIFATYSLCVLSAGLTAYWSIPCCVAILHIVSFHWPPPWPCTPSVMFAWWSTTPPWTKALVKPWGLQEIDPSSFDCKSVLTFWLLPIKLIHDLKKKKSFPSFQLKEDVDVQQSLKWVYCMSVCLLYDVCGLWMCVYDWLHEWLCMTAQVIRCTAENQGQHITS